tara:strand:+ start:3033 stop:5291 length:2259 start_codon:yes stop_codon:yes gene_type:complete
MIAKIIVFVSGAYLLAITMMLGNQLIPSFAAAYGYGYGYGYGGAITQRQQKQREALLALYNSTGGEFWKVSSGWKGKPGSECKWYGVSCTGSTLIKLELSDNNLKGSIPEELSLLNDLTDLDLSNNSLSGGIPDSLKDLTNLTWLSLYNNQLSGELPTWLGKLVRLQRLYLADNRIEGTIPESFEKLENLSILYLSNNNLSGEIPDNIEKLKNLSYLLLDNNSFSGIIPSQIGKIENLILLALNANFLSGNLPPEIFNLRKLEYLLLGNNSLSGLIPEEISRLKNLTYLTLNRNQLAGTIPAGVGLLSKLQTLNLANNNLTGTLGSKIDNSTSLKSLDLSNNQIIGSLPVAITKFDGLEKLDISSNRFSGVIPNLDHLASLKELDISNNRFQNPLPPWMSSAKFEFLNYENSLNLLPEIQILPVDSAYRNSAQFSGKPSYSKVDSDGIPSEYLFLSAVASAGDGPITQVAWLVDGELISQDYNLGFSFLDKSSKVEFAAMDDLGEVAIATIYVDIKPPVPPVAKIIEGQSSFADTDGVRGENILFKATASDSDGSIVKQRWLFNNEEVGKGSEALISLPNGDSVVIFEVTDNVGLQDAQALNVYVEPPQYMPTPTWPYAFNGAEPYPNLELLLNNIGTYEADSGIWRSCAKLTLNGEPYILNGGSSFDINFRIVSGQNPNLQLGSLRRFNQTGTLMSSGEYPDCSGTIDLYSGIYRDTVLAGNLTFETVFELIDGENTIFTLKDYTQLAPPD